MQNVLVSLALQAMERIQGSDELEVCEEVGRGAFGVVFRGIIKATGQEVAIKQIDLENESADLFEVNKEIQILSECRIPQITRYMGCFVKGYKLWVIMEYVNGGSLFEILRPGPITDEMTISVISHQILLALNYLHDQGKIHRDLKSQNILLSQEGEVKLTDFGVSTQLYSNFSRRNTTVGTPYWMAPEIILSNNGGHSYKADIWSLGCCIYELRTEKPPLQNELAPMAALRRISACRSDDDFLRMLNLDNMSDLLKDFLKRCFVVDPANRPSASKLLKHKFITQSTRLENDSKKVLLKRLITRKLVWAQENHQPKTQRFYVPTEIASNQQKWQDAEGSEGGKQKANTINFDFSTIQDVPVLNNPDVLSSTALHENDVSPTPSSGSMNYKNELPQTNKALKLEHIKLLNRVFAKLESKVSISTTQYDELVTLNQKLANLFSPVQYSENNQTRILICQYLKYYLRELTKHQSNAETSSLRLQLQRAIIPSNIQVNHTASSLTENFPRKNTPLNPLDEIENSLLESWLDKMGNY
ncbi:putative serine/threonine-protein kinase [Clavispora lusitaniae]|uniref:non-specific serine/threonine protein kinase n=1 Tax=Clavispora lusitaniae TaxID=36911 RepID=A0AA91Q1Y6_CLALS|nr:putative serine/threonine-protein kinase [Clavispora lusitaniae]